MPSNTFLPPGTTTALTVLYDTPKEGVSRFGPYRAYRVATADGVEHTFFPPRSLFPDLDRLQLRRGAQLRVRATERISPDGRIIPRLELVDAVASSDAPAAPASSAPPVPRRSGGSSESILACVALKAAVQMRGPLQSAEDVLPIADTFLGWLQQRGAA